MSKVCLYSLYIETLHMVFQMNRRECFCRTQILVSVAQSFRILNTNTHRTQPEKNKFHWYTDSHCQQKRRAELLINLAARI